MLEEDPGIRREGPRLNGKKDSVQRRRYQNKMWFSSGDGGRNGSGEAVITWTHSILQSHDYILQSHDPPNQITFSRGEDQSITLLRETSYCTPTRKITIPDLPFPPRDALN